MSLFPTDSAHASMYIRCPVTVLLCYYVPTARRNHMFARHRLADLALFLTRTGCAVHQGSLIPPLNLIPPLALDVISVIDGCG